MNRFKKPRFQHDCDRCLFLGQSGKYDCWYCPPVKTDIMGGSVILRHSSEGSEYLSYDLNTAYRVALSPHETTRGAEFFPTLVACLRMISEIGVVSVRYRPNKKKIAEMAEDRKMIETMGLASV